MLEPRFFYNITLANAEIGKILRDPDTGDVLCFDDKDGFEKAKDYMNEMFPEHTPVLHYGVSQRNSEQSLVFRRRHYRRRQNRLELYPALRR